MKKSVSQKAVPKKAADVLVTQSMLFGVRNELIEKIASSKEELKSEIHSLKAEIQRIAVQTEEQNARNKGVLDAIWGVMERQNRMEEEQKEVRRILIGGKPSSN